MLCKRISVEGEAEEITVSPKPKSRQRHGKRSNPYSTRGLDKLESVHAELSARRKDIARETGAPEAMVRFVYSSKDGWIPVVLGAGDQGSGKKNSGGDATRVSILGPAENNNGETCGELKRKDKGNDINGDSERRGYTVSAPSSSVRAHSDPTDLCATASHITVNPKNIDPGHKQQPPHHPSEDKKFRRVVSMDNWPSTRPVSPVQRSDSFFRRTRPAMTYDASVCALTLMIITLFCSIFYGRFCAILFTSTWLYLVSIFREGSESMRGINRKNNNGRMVGLQSSEKREMANYGWIGEEPEV